MTGSGRPGHAGDRTACGIDQKLEMFADRLCVPKIVIPVEHAVEKRLFPCMPHLMELQRPDVRKMCVKRRGIHKRRDRLPALRTSPGQRIPRNLANRRQFNVAGPMKRKHQASAHHVAQSSVGLPPVPGFAQFLGKPSPACGRIVGDQLTNENKIGICNDPPTMR